MILSSNLKIKHLEKIGLPLMLFPIFYFGDNWINDLEPKLIALIGISLIIFSNTESSIVSKVLSYKLISIIGLSSYSIYLLHQPFFAFFRIFLQNFKLKWVSYENYIFNQSINILKLNQFELNKIDELIYRTLNFLSIFLILIIGYLSYKYIEKSLFNNNYFLLISLFFIFLSIFMVKNVLPGFENKQPKVSIPLIEETVFSDYYCWRKFDLFEDNFPISENCFINNNSSKNLIILGDSSAVTISRNIMKTNLFKKYNIYFVTLNYINFFEDFNSYKRCNNCFLNWIKDNPSTIIFSLELHRSVELNGIYSTDKHSNNNIKVFENNLKLLIEHSNEFFIIEPFPTVPQQNLNPRDLLKNDELGLIKEIYIPLSYWIQNTQNTKKIYNKIENKFKVDIVQTTDLFCNHETDKCSFYLNNKLLYVDQFHLNSSGGQLITQRLSTLLEK
jgi:hypothetical protein